MIKIGLIGEDPNDTVAIKNLLQSKYSGKIQFIILIKGIKGSQLDSEKIKTILPIEFKDKKCRFVIFVRDLDAFKSQDKLYRAKINWFKGLDSAVNNRGILLLNIWELEALILGNVETFKKVYGVDFRFNKDPMLVKEPKEYLKKITSKSPKQYHESHCKELFLKLDIDTVQRNCSFFNEFILTLNKNLANA